eukprot:Anaeramoba_ignava/c17637_g1_i1.p2 GENE.c17637_g1_i1~~c17637_g1_i1.p2  ORF type:complete len:222 (-),score=31.94 c17637_g1_i1:1406-2071(-)
MKCKDFKIMMMDFLYEEINQDDKAKFEQHLQECAECRAEFEAMKTMPDFLNKWQDESAPVQITFTAEESTIAELLKRLIPDFSNMKKAGFAFATVLFVMALFNTKIEMKDGNFSFETHLLPQKEVALTSNELSPEVMEQLRYENFKLTSQLLENYEAKDDKKTMLLMNNLVDEIRTERSQEYNNLVGTVNQAYQTNDYQIRQTNHTVSEIVDLINKSAQNK